jgi:hypothetical protein
MPMRFFRTFNIFCIFISFCLAICNPVLAANPLKTMKTVVIKTSWTSESQDVMAVITKNGKFYAYQSGDEDNFNKIYGITAESVMEKKMVIIHYQDEPDGRIIKDIKFVK